MRKISLLLTISLLTLSISSMLLAQEDVQNSKDHPLISRYPDFHIKKYFQVEFDEAELMVAEFDKKTKKAETIKLEGKITNISYVANKKHLEVSLLQLYKNYEKALKKLNAKFIFTCRNESCFQGDGFGNGTSVGLWVNKIINLYKGVHTSIKKEFGILTATIPTSGTEKIHIMVVVSLEHINGYRNILISIVEPEILDTDKVGIGSPNEMQQAIAAQGKVVLEGIYFDHDKASIKPESAKTLEIIASYLQAKSDVRFYVVGHTDSSGSYEYNYRLSKNRAQAVLDTLVETHNIDPTKLKAVGIGPVSPATSNDNNAGQATNRRVELVLMGQ
ncbi:hypothetical protein MNBD_GAMMA03-420 [hydrothermal vent metagenome]|uniref:OmpA-like domain-containing protein n=1 Tax=hydrothermal vent metagenome TaxID=652676 RepID=A0A3B0WJY7_9ZZZZ